jgi:hypothetical protein
MLGQGWKFQWGRVGRRLKDVETVYAGVPGGTDAAIDTVLSFFEVTHHLKDWLVNDLHSGVDKNAVLEQINGSPVLRLCADLANGSKHLKLKSSQTDDYSTAITSNDAAVFVGTGTASYRFRITSDAKEYDVLEIARDAVRAWSGFLSERGMIPV